MSENKEVSKDGLLSELEPHKRFITTVRSWDSYAKEHALPPSVTLIYQFGSWNNLKDKLGVKKNIRNQISHEHLLDIAKEHTEHFTSKRNWNEYAKKNGLPSQATYIKEFGSWNKVKDLLGLAHTEPVRLPNYTKKDIESVLREHGKNLQNRAQWDEYAKEKGLPTYKTLRKHFSWEEILGFSNVNRTFKYSRDKLISVAKRHYEVFAPASMNAWNEYAKEHSLPTTAAYLRVFGKWKKAKVEVLKSIQ
ncbi:hypothetical protein NC797_07060 [Aquibacillus sp. 3ASR75-11]|uniref:Uncharacterized protein n=1 Tax=Terrihalobacillus insolitus TaxID=2950438 RepID=A0A9X3WU39_9BACI|nr:hypothetical protein [Terrihalobacillus insolitus]MDC3424266.1 hypothetical protein [Terrihalobacillus insolitus]